MLELGLNIRVFLLLPKEDRFYSYIREPEKQGCQKSEGKLVPAVPQQAQPAAEGGVPHPPRGLPVTQTVCFSASQFSQLVSLSSSLTQIFLAAV